jgi:hypothetical protein
VDERSWTTIRFVNRPLLVLIVVLATWVAVGCTDTTGDTSAPTARSTSSTTTTTVHFATYASATELERALRCAPDRNHPLPGNERMTQALCQLPSGETVSAVVWGSAKERLTSMAQEVDISGSLQHCVVTPGWMLCLRSGLGTDSVEAGSAEGGENPAGSMDQLWQVVGSKGLCVSYPEGPPCSKAEEAWLDQWPPS